jgi:hypothetical protein
LRTKSEILMSHLSARCDIQSKKINENNGEFFDWCGREETAYPGIWY